MRAITIVAMIGMLWLGFSMANWKSEQILVGTALKNQAITEAGR